MTSGSFRTIDGNEALLLLLRLPGRMLSVLCLLRGEPALLCGVPPTGSGVTCRRPSRKDSAASRVQPGRAAEETDGSLRATTSSSRHRRRTRSIEKPCSPSHFRIASLWRNSS